ncbi:MAG TPA: DUF4214 domain-containing protein, partial [Ramlibacter sp.]|nr:DUF4214 domain-containing protein [Ramlibacter sp.]
QYRAQRDAFDDLVARAKGGDLEAAQQVGGAGKSLITARRASANTREQVVAEDIYVRQQLAGVLAVTGSGQAPNTGPADDVAKAQAALATATEKAAAAQLLAVQSGASLTAVTTDLAAQYAAATAEVARWSSAVSASGASRTAEQVNILGAYNTALANLATAQSSQAALLAATQGLDLSGSQQSANAWSSAVDAAVLAQASYTSAQAAAATTSTDLQAALAAAAAAGLTLAAVKSPLDVFLESVVAFTDAQAVAAAVNADLYDGSADLVAQYESQVTAAAAATAALGAFQVRVAGIDLSALDQLSQLDGLMADYNAAIAALDALDPRTSVYGRQVTAAYEDILGRAPDAEGLNYWIDQLINGDSDERMRERITASATYMASPEWAAQNPGAPQYGTPEWQAIYGGYLNPHAAGLDRVPYDNYPAMLHVDETVLNRDAAAAWRASRTAPAGTAASGLSADELRSQHADFRRMMLEVIKRVQNVDLRLKKFDEDGIAERV